MERDARSVANEIIQRGINDGNLVTPLKLIKLVYFCHAWMLALYDEPLLDEPVEAWKYGPVISSVYDSVSRYGRMQIKSLINKAPTGEFSEYEIDIINQVWKVYGKFSAVKLSSMTHKKGTPWHEIWHRDGAFATISDELISQHYQVIKAQSDD